MKENLNAAEEETFSRHLDRESRNMTLSTKAFFTALAARRSAAGDAGTRK
jgi:hypothetical protein